MIKVLIADDIRILRQGLEAILSQDSDIEVVATASDGEEAYIMCQLYKPDVVLMDMRMPEFDGEYGTRKIKQDFPDIKVLILTTFDDNETISKALSSGADGYILKEMEDEKIIQSVKCVCGGMNIFGGNVYNHIQKKFLQPEPADFELTERERQILVCLTAGLDNREIAKKLFLAEGTVRNHISKMLEKLHLKDRTQLAVFAVKNNIT